MNAVANDPTRAGAPVPNAPDGRARVSLPEIEALCFKAARGAGLSWGVAEEAGAAARWLAAQDLPGAELLAHHLADYDHRPWRQVAPLIDGRTWRAREAGRLCPVAAGTALCDRAGLAEGPGDEPLIMCNVASPALIVPFAGFAAARLGVALGVDWDGVQAIVTRDGLVEATGAHAFEARAAEVLRVVIKATSRPARPPCHSRVVDLTWWRQLDRLALRTTVPPSNRSRADAGAGSTDND